jgi:hypothetical protein
MKVEVEPMKNRTGSQVIRKKSKITRDIGVCCQLIKSKLYVVPYENLLLKIFLHIKKKNFFFLKKFFFFNDIAYNKKFIYTFIQFIAISL